MRRPSTGRGLQASPERAISEPTSNCKMQSTKCKEFPQEYNHKLSLSLSRLLPMKFIKALLKKKEKGRKEERISAEVREGEENGQVKWEEQDGTNLRSLPGCSF